MGRFRDEPELVPYAAQVYSIPRFDPDDAFSFLALVARKMNKLRRGGVPDRVQAAKAVLRDWNVGRVSLMALVFVCARFVCRLAVSAMVREGWSLPERRSRRYGCQVQGRLRFCAETLRVLSCVK